MFRRFCFFASTLGMNGRYGKMEMKETEVLLSESFNDVSNNLILNETINFIFKSERFKTLEAYSQI